MKYSYGCVLTVYTIIGLLFATALIPVFKHYDVCVEKSQCSSNPDDIHCNKWQVIATTSILGFVTIILGLLFSTAFHCYKSYNEKRYYNPVF